MLHLKSSINWLLTLAGVLGCGAILAGLAGADHDLLTINVISLFALFITGFLLVSLTDGIPSVSNSLAGAIVLQCLCAFAIAFTINSDILYILLVIIAGQIPFIFKQTVALAVLVCNHLLLSLILYIHGVELTSFWQFLLQSSLFFAFQIFAFAASRVAVNEAIANKQLTLLNAELVSTRALLSDSIRQSERLKISRDLHDICGHQLTALILNLEFAAKQTEQQSGIANQTLLQSKELARALLNEIRDIVKTIRHHDQLDLYAALNEIKQVLPGTSLNIEIEQSVTIESHTVAECILRICQEAITNAIKHSTLRDITVSISRQDDSLIVQISNSQLHQHLVKFGNGLTSISERASQLGGTLSLTQTPSQFVICVTLPLNDSRGTL